ncbi:MAG: hypothetical protein JST58_09820 [Bacteroidetes bacterium]|nr:hypothetical protein [Bacteroidota bacterium]
MKNTFYLLLVLAILCSCNKRNGNRLSQRTYRMGFQNSAPRMDFNLAIQSLKLWTESADAAMISGQVPWDSLLKGENPVAYVVNNYQLLVNFYRSKNFKVWVFVDPENGLNRAADADDLVADGGSIAQTAMQEVYQRYVFVMDSVLRPDHLGLAMETNLIRGIAPDSIYHGVKIAANNAAISVRKYDKNVKLSVSVQVDYAWGELNGGSVYQGVEQDFSDFLFLQELGISSYPYFNFKTPASLPLNYYTKLLNGRPTPVFVSEGGWTSQSISNYNGQPITSSNEIQSQYISRQSQLLDNVQAIALFQLTFTDIELAALPVTVNPTIKYFAYLGMVDSLLNPKPALSTWDSIFQRSLKPGD